MDNFTPKPSVSPPSQSEHLRSLIALRKPIPNSNRHILIVDDDDDNLKLVKASLEFEGYVVQGVPSGEKAILHLSQATPDLVLLDINMPGLTGLETLGRVRKHTSEYTSVIFISGNTTTDDVVRGLDAGADDYLRKPFNALELLARVRSQLRIKDIRDQLVEANKTLQDLVDYDELTGLLNMRAFSARLDYELRRARRFKHALGVVMMDLDNFKRVNDEHDHLFGSYVLKEVGRIIGESVRSVDFAARYGGDEFIVGVVQATEDGATRFADRLRIELEEAIFDNGHDKMKVTVSMGVTVVPPEKLVDIQTLIRAADHGLYQAKANGRNRIVVETGDKGRP